MVPALSRLPEAPDLVDEGGYFVVHAPRQSGKTTTLRALARDLTASGKYAAVHVSCEGGAIAGDDYESAQRWILDALRLSATRQLPPALRPPDPWPPASPEAHVYVGLDAWSSACPLPVVLVLDEIDTLDGKSLVSVLRQLRAGFPDRPEHFPWSVVLCGMRDVRDYKMASGGDATRTSGPSPFNIKVESLRLGNFTTGEVAALYAQHTAETGQPFLPGTVERVMELSGGQPWLVNALAREVIRKMGVAPPAPITAEHIDEAKERLILARATHLDSLLERLKDDRVRRVLEPLLAGAVVGQGGQEDDLQYCRDLGLVAEGLPVRMANPIYNEVVVRVLASAAEASILVEPRSFVLSDGRLDLERLLREFVAFWREHGEAVMGRMPYSEVAAQLVMMAYLHRVVNGGGTVDREFGVGKGRMDLMVRWPYRDGDGRKEVQREALELKVWRPRDSDPRGSGLEQLDGYLARLGLDHGVLVIFDGRPRAPGPQEGDPLERVALPSGRRGTVVRA